MNTILTLTFLLELSCAMVKSKNAQNNYFLVHTYDKLDIVPGRSVICYGGKNILFTPAITSNPIPGKIDNKRTVNNFFVIKYNKYFIINKKRLTD
ncbi:MAG: hypothetical protein V3V72_12120 [Ignavibacteriaceae bacterium]